MKRNGGLSRVDTDGDSFLSDVCLLAPHLCAMVMPVPASALWMWADDW